MKQTAQSGALAAQNEKQTEVAKNEKMKNVKDLLEARMGEIQKVLPSVISPQQFLRLALNALQSTPHLMECTKLSFYGAIMQCAQLGLKPNVNGEAYLIHRQIRRGNGTGVQRDKVPFGQRIARKLPCVLCRHIH